MIRELQQKELKVMYEIINDSAISYKGIIPTDRWREPYITWEELNKQINEGIHFLPARCQTKQTHAYSQ